MKKITIAITALASLGIFAPGAGAADVYSANVVGYTKIAISSSSQTVKGSTLLAYHFENIDPSASLTVNDIFVDSSEFIGGYDTSDSDVIQMWNGERYVSFFLAAADWSEEMGDGIVDEHKNNKWLTTEFAVATSAVKNGDAFWFVRALNASGITITTLGQVSKEDAVFAPSTEFSLFSNPFPTALYLNDGSIDWVASGVKGGYDAGDSDAIQTWDGSSYASYFFSADDWSEEMGDGSVDEHKNNKWLTTSFNLVTDPISLGEGMWYKKSGIEDVEITFTSPNL